VDVNKDNRNRLSEMGKSPSLSPDDSKIIYSYGQIWMMNIDGTDNRQLTDGGGHQPQFSPDGLSIAYLVNYNATLYTMDINGNNRKDLLSEKEYSVRSFDFSPDGRKIVFSATENQTTDIYIINTDGDSLMNLTNDSYENEQPHFSPDGKRIAYIRNYGDDQRNDDSDGIHIMDIDGSHNIDVIKGDYGEERTPRFSPDGLKIAFQRSSSLYTRSNSLYIFDIEAKYETNLETIILEDNFNFSPDGNNIVYIKLDSKNGQPYSF
jgi:TolB protein